MKKYYHFTGYENLERINEYGLIPQSGGRTRSIGDNRNAIFLSEGITNAILMYSSILWHYNRHSGDMGLEAIEYYKKRIELYNDIAKTIPPDEEDIAELEAMKKAIEWVKQIMSYKDFNEYMSDGVYLSIENVKDIDCTDPRDCYTTKNIPAERIKIIVLKNKKTGEIIDSRESVLAYFMSITPIKNIIDNTRNVISMKIIKDLYQDKLEDINYYNKTNFELVEVPINLYLKNNLEQNNKKR